MDIFDKAIEFAVRAHSGSFRKGTVIPYIVHPMEVAAIVATMTNDRDVMAGAVLHDVVEDTEYTIDDIRREFGDKIADLVDSESENKREDLPPEQTWKIRKQKTLEHLERAPIEAKMITLGDKLSNIRAIYRDYCAVGDRVWERFNQRDKNEHAWYYRGIAERLGKLGETFAYQEYVELVGKVFGCQRYFKMSHSLLH